MNRLRSLLVKLLDRLERRVINTTYELTDSVRRTDVWIADVVNESYEAAGQPYGPDGTWRWARECWPSKHIELDSAQEYEQARKARPLCF